MSDNRSSRSFNNLEAVSVLVRVRHRGVESMIPILDIGVPYATFSLCWQRRRQRASFHPSRMMMVVGSKCFCLYYMSDSPLRKLLTGDKDDYLREMRMSWNIDTDIKHISTGIDLDNRHK